MESVRVDLSAERYDQAIHGGLDELPILQEGGDLAVFVKPDCTEGGQAGVVITFTVALPDGTMARAQAVTTANLMEQIGQAITGWKMGGHIK